MKKNTGGMNEEFRDAETYWARGAIAPLAFSSRGARGAKVPFSKNITLTKFNYFKKLYKPQPVVRKVGARSL